MRKIALPNKVLLEEVKAAPLHRQHGSPRKCRSTAQHRITLTSPLKQASKQGPKQGPKQAKALYVKTRCIARSFVVIDRPYMQRTRMPPSRLLQPVLVVLLVAQLEEQWSQGSCQHRASSAPRSPADTRWAVHADRQEELSPRAHGTGPPRKRKAVSTKANLQRSIDRNVPCLCLAGSSPAPQRLQP